jgi:hypothetical protein
MHGNKFKNRSGYEARIKENLDERGYGYGYETRTYNYTKVICPCCGGIAQSGEYTPDFVFERGNIVYLLVEGKGQFTPDDRRKLINVTRENPGINLRILFQKNDRLGKGSETRNTDWALKHGFYCAVGEVIPDAWIRNEDCPMVILPEPKAKKVKSVNPRKPRAVVKASGVKVRKNAR